MVESANRRLVDLTIPLGGREPLSSNDALSRFVTWLDGSDLKRGSTTRRRPVERGLGLLHRIERFAIGQPSLVAAANCHQALGDFVFRVLFFAPRIVPKGALVQVLAVDGKLFGSLFQPRGSFGDQLGLAFQCQLTR